MTPLAFLIPLLAGALIGAAAMWAAHNLDRITRWVDGPPRLRVHRAPYSHVRRLDGDGGGAG